MEKVATVSTRPLLEMSKLHPKTIERVIKETHDMVEMADKLAEGVEVSKAIPASEKRDTLMAVLPDDMRFLVEENNSDGPLGKYIHKGAHELLDLCTEVHKAGEKLSKPVVFALEQAICLGWRLANAYLEQQSAETGHPGE